LEKTQGENQCATILYSKVKNWLEVAWKGGGDWSGKKVKKDVNLKLKM
jgi:hypothetical protein